MVTSVLRGICSIRSAPPLISNWQYRDHIRHAVVGAGVAVRASLFKVDAADQNVDHIALVLLGGLDLLADGGGTLPPGGYCPPPCSQGSPYTTTPEITAITPITMAKGQPQRGLFLFLRRRGASFPPIGRPGGGGGACCAPGGAAGVLPGQSAARAA